MIYKLDSSFDYTPLGWQRFIFELGMLASLSHNDRYCVINDALSKYNARYRPSSWLYDFSAEVDFDDGKHHTMFVLKYGSLE